MPEKSESLASYFRERGAPMGGSSAFREGQQPQQQGQGRSHASASNHESFSWRYSHINGGWAQSDNRHVDHVSVVEAQASPICAKLTAFVCTVLSEQRISQECSLEACSLVVCSLVACSLVACSQVACSQVAPSLAWLAAGNSRYCKEF